MFAICIVALSSCGLVVVIAAAGLLKLIGEDTALDLIYLTVGGAVLTILGLPR